MISKKSIVAEKQFNGNPNFSHKPGFTKESKMQTADDVYKFWFPADKTVKEKMDVWFGAGGPDFDQKIKDEFGDLVSEAVISES